MPFYPGWKEEEGVLEIAGKSVELKRVITQKKPYIEIEGHLIEVEFWELLGEGMNDQNIGLVHLGESWIEGHTQMRRWAGQGGRPERQNVFTSDDGSLSFVVTSEPITV